MASPTSETRQQPQFSPFFVNVLAGGGAGLLETCSTYPLDLARNRIQLIKGPKSKTVLSVLVDVWTQQGEGLTTCSDLVHGLFNRAKRPALGPPQGKRVAPDRLT